jgi:hypothetical protein
MNQVFQVTLANPSPAKVIQVSNVLDLPEAIARLGLQVAQPVLTLVGGASGISPSGMSQLQTLFTEVLAPLAETLGASVVDGGTDAGIMHLMGQAHAHIKATFPLVGVAAIGTVALPFLRPISDDAIPLEPHHTHFVLVPGKSWGDDSPWIARVTGVLAQQAASVTVLINGGKIAWIDATNSVKANRPVLIIAGSGRTADTLAAMLRGRQPDQTGAKLIASGLLQAIDLESGFDAIRQTLQELLER